MYSLVALKSRPSRRAHMRVFDVAMLALGVSILLTSCGGDNESDAETAPDYPVGNISTVAGTGVSGSDGDGGPATTAQIYAPSGVAVDGEGNVYVSGDYRVRRVDEASGVITTVAGTGSPGYGGDGVDAVGAQLDVPEGIAVDSQGNLYIADTDNQRIRRVDASTGIITTVAGGIKVTSEMRLQGYTGDDGPAMEAYIPRPVGIAIDADGNIYIADRDANSVRRVDAASGEITTVAGGTTITQEQGDEGFIRDGELATSAFLDKPSGVAVDSRGNVYIADSGNLVVRKVDASTGIITSVARGDNPPEGASKTAAKVFTFVPRNVAVDSEDNLYIVADVGIYKLDVATGESITVAGGGSGDLGDGGPATSATLAGPNAVAVKPDGSFLIAELTSNRIREVTAPVPR